MPVLIIQCVGTCQWLRLNFTYFTPVLYLQQHPAAKCPTILNSSVLTVIGEFQHGWVAGARSGQDGGLKRKV